MMAIQPPTDLVLDVARAADPDKLKVAATRLQSIAKTAASDGEGFANAYDSVTSDLAAGGDINAGGSGRHYPVNVASMRTAMRTRTAIASAVSPTQQFEALILQQFIEAMLPDDAETVFGKGTAGDIWKSMMAEQISKQVVSAGGIGISGMLDKSTTSSKA
ncbi:rod-binding protein [Breoghania sp.]|uniref:rod-binding protein n=1 Tax=Breoghania sp. TaxID=2065378 RepID=UPI002AA7BB4F|nr:rod-binding protein [Breoghania sp.]